MSTRVLASLSGLVLLGGLLAAGPVGRADDGGARTAAGLTAAAPDGALTAPAPVAPEAAPDTVAGSGPATPAPVPASAVPAPAARSLSTTGYAPYAAVGPVVLHAPGDVVEVIGFHQSGDDGAQPQEPVPGLAVRHGLLEQRGRDTHPTGAADVVVDPAREVRAPVTGTVVRARAYTLYCRHVDEFLVVEPDDRPGWEVKVLHVQGLAVRAGQRVEAGVTVVAAGARLLPFASQVDDFTGEPSWPHVHVEVVDPSVPDRPGTGGGGGC